MQGVAQLLRHLTPLVQQGNLVEQLEDVIDDKYTNEVSCRKQLIQQLQAHTVCQFSSLLRIAGCCYGLNHHYALVCD